MNWKYILIAIILVTILGGGIFIYRYQQVSKEETEPPEVELPEKMPPESPKETPSETPEESEPQILSAEFIPPLFSYEGYPTAYKKGTKVKIKGKNLGDFFCLAHSPGPGIEAMCRPGKKFPIKVEEDFDIIEFTLEEVVINNEIGLLCHRLSDFHEIHLFDQAGELIKKLYCEAVERAKQE